MKERESELKFVHYKDEFYTLYYREKNFVPQEIVPTSLFGKINRFIFGKRYTKNKWIELYHFCYGWKDEWIHKSCHPSEFIQNYLVKYKEIKSVKEKFNTIDKINEYISENSKHYIKMVEMYEEEHDKWKEVIY